MYCNVIFLVKFYELVTLTDDVSTFLGEGKDETNERQDNSGIANGKLFSYISKTIIQEWINQIQYLYL